MNKNQNEDKEITKLKAQHCYAPKVSGDSDQPRTSTGGSRGLGKFLLVPSQLPCATSELNTGIVRTRTIPVYVLVIMLIP